MDILDTSIRDAYKSQLVEENNTTDLQLLQAKEDTEPITTIRTVLEEEEPVYNDVSRNVIEIALDLAQLDTDLILSAGEYETLMDDMNTQLSVIQKQLDYEKERLQDTNMICGNITDFTTVKPLNSSAFSGDFYVEDDGQTFSCYREEMEEVSYTVRSVTGNGEAGNDHVQGPQGANLEKTDTSDTEFLSDGDMATAFEYNRIESTDSDVTDTYSFVNSDSQSLRCTITLYSEQESTLAYINADDTNLILEDVQVSVDGTYYTSILSEEMSFNNRDYIYNNYKYIYGSGLISYSPANYVRFTFRSDTTTDDVIVNSDDEVINATRKVIALHEITLYDNIYAESTMESSELITSGQLECIAVFANVYIPYNFPVTDDYVTMTLTVNGVAYPLVPINGNDLGNKIIRYNEAPTYQSVYAVYISEPITSANLSITLSPYNDIQTPFIGNIKICAGLGES